MKITEVDLAENKIVVAEERKKPNSCVQFCIWIVVLVLILLNIFVIYCLIRAIGIHLEKPKSNNELVASAQFLPLISTVKHKDNSNKVPIHNTVSPSFVHHSLKSNPYIVVLDTGSDQLFKAEHVPTSRHFDIDKVIKGNETLAHPLEFQTYVRKLGVDVSSHVVLYDHEDSLSLSTVYYVWWIFKLYGHERISVMQGGYNTWEAATLDTSSIGKPRASKTHQRKFQAHWNSNWIVTYADILHNFAAPKYQLVDSRSFQEINETEDLYEKGKISGAINILAKFILDDNGMLRNRTTIVNIFRNSGIGEHPVIVYGSDVFETSVVAFALYNSGVTVSIYSGGWPEWSRLAPNVYKVLF